MQFWMDENPGADVEEMIWAAQNIAGYYGEAAASLACEMYDATAAAMGANVPAAVPASVPDYGETAKAIRGTLKNKDNTVPSTVGRMVKQMGADTTMQNARRDQAQFAWIPNGDTCAFCLTLASQGWQYMRADTLKYGHAEHIHANCDCTFAIRFDTKSDVEGYDPDRYRKIYDEAEGDTPGEKINAIRRAQYAVETGKDETLEEALTESKNTANRTVNATIISEKELEKLSENWYLNDLTYKEQAATVAFDTYNFTRDPRQEENTKTLEEALSKFELPAPITTYRGVTEDEFASLLFDYGSEDLKTAEMKGTSLIEQRAVAFAEPRGGWIVEYHIDKGKNGAYFDGGVPGSNEQQFVINRNIKYTIKTVDKEQKRIIVEVGG